MTTAPDITDNPRAWLKAEMAARWWERTREVATSTTAMIQWRRGKRVRVFDGPTTPEAVQAFLAHIDETAPTREAAA